MSSSWRSWLASKVWSNSPATTSKFHVIIDGLKGCKFRPNPDRPKFEGPDDTSVADNLFIRHADFNEVTLVFPKRQVASDEYGRPRWGFQGFATMSTDFVPIPKAEFDDTEGLEKYRDETTTGSIILLADPASSSPGPADHFDVLRTNFTVKGPLRLEQSKQYHGLPTDSQWAELELTFDSVDGTSKGNVMRALDRYGPDVYKVITDEHGWESLEKLPSAINYYHDMQGTREAEGGGRYQKGWFRLLRPLDGNRIPSDVASDTQASAGTQSNTEA